jgi:ribonuclease D
MTWHPTFALFYNPYEKGAFMADLDRWARAIKGQLVIPEVKLNIKPTLQDLVALRGEPFITCDIETGGRSPSTPWTGKDPTQAKLKVVGFGTPEGGLAIWWDDATKQMRDETRRLLADPSILKVLQNGPWFDNRVLVRYGMQVNNYMDTRDMRRAISTTSRLSLGYMGSLYLDIEDWKLKGGDDEK